MAKDTRLISGPLQTERQPNGRRKLLRDLQVQVGDRQVHVPQGTSTDYTTAPFFARPFIHWSRVDIAGVVHDYLYQEGPYPRGEADRIWREVAMAGEHSANAAQAWSGWLLLRMGGWWPWYRYRKHGNPHA